MIKLFLRAKHWQLFILMMGVPFLFQIITIVYVIVADTPMFTFYTFPIFMLLYVSIFFSWFGSIGVGLHKFLPEQHSLNIKKFKNFFFIPLFYFTFLMFSMLSLGIFSDFPPPNGMFGISFAIIIPLHLFSMFYMFYMLYFCSKTIKSIELNTEVGFLDYAGEFFLLWFYIIGIWILQPRINKIHSEKANNSPNFELNK